MEEKLVDFFFRGCICFSFFACFVSFFPLSYTFTFTAAVYDGI